MLFLCACSKEYKQPPTKLKLTQVQHSLVERLRKDPIYLKVSGWDTGNPLLLSPRLEKRRYELGVERTPQTDLMLIVDALFTPIAPLTSSSERWKIDESVWCQHATVVRYIQGIAKLTDTSLPSPPTCHGFEAWARMDELKAIEILLATPSTHDPVSSFGHTTLRLRYSDLDYTPSETIYELVAFVEPHDGGISYVFTGLMGGYPLILEPSSLQKLSHSHRAEQHRDLVRYEFTLTTEEKRALMTRIWEVERRGYLPYQFLSKNCSYYIAWLLETSLFDSRELDTLSEFFVPPSDVVDHLAEQNLIREHPRPLRAYFHDVEVWRSDQQNLASNFASIPSLVSDMSDPKTLLEDVSHLKQVVERVAQDPKVQVKLRRDLLRFIGLELKIRQHQISLNKREIQTIRERVIVKYSPEEVPYLAELVRIRRSRYLSENPEYRRQTLKRHQAHVQRLLDQIDSDQYPELKAKLSHADKLRRDYLVLTASYAHLNQSIAVIPEEQGSEASQVVPTVSTHEAQETWSTHSGFRYSTLGLMISGAQEINLSWKRAIWRELLGDKRSYGVTPQRSLTLVENELMIRWREGSPYPDWLGNSSKLFEFSSFSPPFLPEQLSEISFPQTAPFWGWLIRSYTYLLGDDYHAELTAAGGFLTFNPATSKWQLKFLVELSPLLTEQPWLIAGAPLIKNNEMYSASGQKFERNPLRAGASSGALVELSRRIGNTGHLSLQSRYEKLVTPNLSGDLQDVFETVLHLELPISTTEAQRFNGSLRYLCLERCALTFETGIAW